MNGSKSAFFRRACLLGKSCTHMLHRVCMCGGGGVGNTQREESCAQQDQIVVPVCEKRPVCVGVVPGSHVPARKMSCGPCRVRRSTLKEVYRI